MIAYLRKKSVVTCARIPTRRRKTCTPRADGGLTQITHLFNAQSPLHHRRPGVPGAVWRTTESSCRSSPTRLHLHPDVLRIAALCKAPGRSADFRLDGSGGHAGRTV
ncbi:MAG: hypothetical protein ACLTV6_01975 [Christensenellales bacterium]